MRQPRRAALRLSLRQLQIFVAVARAGSTTAAAPHVALSQSATSAALNELEALLGGNLFDRVGRRLILNERGRSMLPEAMFDACSNSPVTPASKPSNATTTTATICKAK